jgi:glycosyltransferase involved in cell wall biosynthesis
MTQTYPKISIVTPSYNQGQYIEETILSVIGQHYPNLEYIIIDGGSTDNTVEIIKKYEKHLAYWVSEKDNGQSHAINKGLEKCTGDIFNWLNSDDYLVEQSLNTIAENFQNKNIDVLCGQLEEFIEDEDKACSIIRKVQLTQNIEQNIIMGSICQPSTFYKMDIIKRLDGVNTNLDYTMDLDLWIKYLLNHGVGNIKTIPKVFAKFRVHDHSKTSTSLDKFYNDRDSIYYQLFSLLDTPTYLMQYLNPKRKYLDNTHYNVANIKKYTLITFWILNQIKNTQNSRKKWLLTYYYVRIKPFKNLKEYKILFLDYLFPKTFSRIKQSLNR